MNNKLSGAQLVLVPIKQMGKNTLPFVEHVADKLIKFIDFYPCSYVPRYTTPGCASSQDMYITIMDSNGSTELHKQLPLERLDYTATLGVRQPICKRISMKDCYIDCQNAAAVGTMAALVFWYELPQYSKANDSIATQTDSIEIPITNVSQKNVLPDIDRLTGKRFRRLLLGTPTVTPDRNTGLAAPELANCYLTLCKGSYLILADVPLPLLYQMQMLEKTEFQNIIFDLQNSYITIGGAGTVTPSDYVGKYVFMNLQYEVKKGE